MPNFDSLRTSTLGALSYLCKPQKPVALAGCWPLFGDGKDVSRYGHPLGGSLTYSNVGDLTNALVMPNDTSISFACNPIVMGGDWSIDVHFYKGHANANPVSIQLGDFIFVEQNNDGVTSGIFIGSTKIDNGPTRGTQSGYYGIVKSGTTIYVYRTGSKIITINNVEISGTANTLIVKMHQYTGTNAIQNLRIAATAISTGATYPVQAAAYTGYEPL